MKDYDPGTWGLRFVFSCEGSVFPKALACAFPNALVAVSLWYVLREMMTTEVFEETLSGVFASQAWSAYNWVIGFVVSYRAQRAYSRWWEGGTLLQQARGEWFNSYSSLIAFCTRDDGKLQHVRVFQKTLSRLTSMLYASALMSIATEPDLDFEIIDASGLSEAHLEYLRTQPDKCEIIMQWIQRLIVDNMNNGVLSIPPPILSRVFQELSRGIVNVHNVRKITEFQFPFPAAQMIVTMLILQWFLTPLMAALMMQTPVWAFFVAFLPIFACWGINYIATEIEQPFGTDFNDMPLHFMQSSLNTSIMSLLDTYAQSPPDFDEKLESHDQLIMAESKKPGEQAYHFSEMRSVRYVTIQDPEQLIKVKHHYNPSMRSSYRVSEYLRKQSWAGTSQRMSNMMSSSTSVTSCESSANRPIRRFSPKANVPSQSRVSSQFKSVVPSDQGGSLKSEPSSRKSNLLGLPGRPIFPTNLSNQASHAEESGRTSVHTPDDGSAIEGSAVGECISTKQGTQFNPVSPPHEFHPISVTAEDPPGLIVSNG